MTLTKARLLESISKRLELRKGRSSQLLETLLEILMKTLESGEDVLISRFGKFSVKEKGERKGRNPATGDALTLRARRVVTFQCSTTLRDKIRRKR